MHFSLVFIVLELFLAAPPILFLVGMICTVVLDIWIGIEEKLREANRGVKEDEEGDGMVNGKTDLATCMFGEWRRLETIDEEYEAEDEDEDSKARDTESETQPGSQPDFGENNSDSGFGFEKEIGEVGTAAVTDVGILFQMARASDNLLVRHEPVDIEKWRKEMDTESPHYCNTGQGEASIFG